MSHKCGDDLKWARRGDAAKVNTSQMEIGNSGMAPLRARLSRMSKERSILLIQRTLYLNTLKTRANIAAATRPAQAQE